MDTKYIVGEINGILTAVTFSGAIPHVSLSKVFDEGTIDAAGFVRIENNQNGDVPTVEAFGESVSLKQVSSPKRDNRLIRRALGLVALT